MPSWPELFPLVAMGFRGQLVVWAEEKHLLGCSTNWSCSYSTVQSGSCYSVPMSTPTPPPTLGPCPKPHYAAHDGGPTSRHLLLHRQRLPPPPCRPPHTATPVPFDARAFCRTARISTRLHHRRLAAQRRPTSQSALAAAANELVGLRCLRRRPFPQPSCRLRPQRHHRLHMGPRPTAGLSPPRETPCHKATLATPKPEP